MVLDGAKKVTISTQGSSCEISLDGSGKAIKIEAQQSITIKAPQIKLDASGTFDVTSGGKATLKGSMMDIDGGGILNVKGGLIKLN